MLAGPCPLRNVCYCQWVIIPVGCEANCQAAKCGIYPPDVPATQVRSALAQYRCTSTTSTKDRNDMQPSPVPQTLLVASTHSLRIAHLAKYQFCGCFEGPCDRAEHFQDVFFGVPTRAPDEPGREMEVSAVDASGAAICQRRWAMLCRPRGQHPPPSTKLCDYWVAISAPSNAVRRLQGRQALRWAHPWDAEPS